VSSPLVVWFLVFGIVMGVIFIGSSACWFLVSWWESSVLGCVVFGVFYRVGVITLCFVFVGVCYRGGGHLPWAVWLLVCGIVLGFINLVCGFVGVWYRFGCHLPRAVWLLVCGIVLDVITLGCAFVGVCYRGGVHLP